MKNESKKDPGVVTMAVAIPGMIWGDRPPP